MSNNGANDNADLYSLDFDPNTVNLNTVLNNIDNNVTLDFDGINNPFEELINNTDFGNIGPLPNFDIEPLDSTDLFANLDNTAPLGNANFFANLNNTDALGGTELFANLDNTTPLEIADPFANLNNNAPLGSTDTFANLNTTAPLSNTYPFANLDFSTPLDLNLDPAVLDFDASLALFNAAPALPPQQMPRANARPMGQFNVGPQFTPAVNLQPVEQRSVQPQSVPAANLQQRRQPDAPQLSLPPANARQVERNDAQAHGPAANVLRMGQPGGFQTRMPAANMQHMRQPNVPQQRVPAATIGQTIQRGVPQGNLGVANARNPRQSNVPSVYQSHAGMKRSAPDGPSDQIQASGSSSKRAKTAVGAQVTKNVQQPQMGIQNMPGMTDAQKIEEIARKAAQDALDNEESRFEFSSPTPPNLEPILIEETGEYVDPLQHEFPDLSTVNPLKLAAMLKLPYNPAKTFTRELAWMGHSHLNFLWDKLHYLLDPPRYHPTHPDAQTPPASPVQGSPNNQNTPEEAMVTLYEGTAFETTVSASHPLVIAGSSSQAMASNSQTTAAEASSSSSSSKKNKDQTTAEMLKTAKTYKYDCIYPDYSRMFKTGKDARDARKQTQVAPRSVAPDLDIVKRTGRDYWVKRIYNSMKDVSKMCDGPTSINTKRFTETLDDNFTQKDLEASAHKVFDAALHYAEHGWTRPMVWFPANKRGDLADRTHVSVEMRLGLICACLRHFKACVDDALRGGVPLDQLVANPSARLDSKLSNANSNAKRSLNNQKAQAVFENAKKAAKDGGKKVTVEIEVDDEDEDKPRVKRAKGISNFMQLTAKDEEKQKKGKKRQD